MHNPNKRYGPDDLAKKLAKREADFQRQLKKARRGENKYRKAVTRGRKFTQTKRK